MIKEKRKYPRIPSKLVARLRAASRDGNDNDETFLNESASTSDISKGGAFIETMSLFEIGTTIKFDLSLPNRQNIEVVAVVRRCVDSKIRGIGVQFLKVTTRDREKLNSYIDSASKK